MRKQLHKSLILAVRKGLKFESLRSVDERRQKFLAAKKQVNEQYDQVLKELAKK